MNADRLKGIIALGEAVDREFKSDRRKISDAEIYEEVVAMANADGGVLLIGVENDGTISGAQPRHEETTDPIRLQSAIFNNTSPNINTRISVPAKVSTHWSSSGFGRRSHGCVATKV